jgi:hypothetical protein
LRSANSARREPLGDSIGIEQLERAGIHHCGTGSIVLVLALVDDDDLAPPCEQRESQRQSDRTRTDDDHVGLTSSHGIHPDVPRQHPPDVPKQQSAGADVGVDCTFTVSATFNRSTGLSALNSSMEIHASP